MVSPEEFARPECLNSILQDVSRQKMSVANIISSLSCSSRERSLKPVASISYTHTHIVPFSIVEDLYSVGGVFCNFLIIKFDILHL